MDIPALIPVFVTLVDAGSFTKAARILRVSRPMVSQYVKELEEKLGVSLLNRTTRSLSTTDAGSLFYQRCKKLVADTDLAIEDVRDAHNQLIGRLKIGATIDIAAEYLPKILASFCRKHPDIHFEIHASDELSDVVKDRLDLTIRVGWVHDSTHHAAKIANVKPVVCASPGVFEGADPPENPVSATAYPWIHHALLPMHERLKFTNEKGESTSIICDHRITVNSVLAVRGIVREGLGIGILPDYQVKDDLKHGRLVEVCKGWSLKAAGIWAIYPHGKLPPARVRAFIDALQGLTQ